MQDARGYYEARRLLLQRYGQPYKIATAFVDRLTIGLQIKGEDGPGLQKFSTLLTSCKNTLQEIGYINKLENPDNMRKIVERLPFGMKAKWLETVDSILQREEREVNLKDIVQFIETRAGVANHPIFGKITSDTRRGDTPSNKGKQHQNIGRNYVIEGKEERPFSAGSPTKRNSISCPSCCVTHWLSQCDKFKGMSVDEWYKFV